MYRTGICQPAKSVNEAPAARCTASRGLRRSVVPGSVMSSPESRGGRRMPRESPSVMSLRVSRHARWALAFTVGGTPPRASTFQSGLSCGIGDLRDWRGGLLLRCRRDRRQTLPGSPAMRRWPGVRLYADPSPRADAAGACSRGPGPWCNLVGSPACSAVRIPGRTAQHQRRMALLWTASAAFAPHAAGWADAPPVRASRGDRPTPVIRVGRGAPTRCLKGAARGIRPHGPRIAGLDSCVPRHPRSGNS